MKDAAHACARSPPTDSRRPAPIESAAPSRRRAPGAAGRSRCPPRAASETDPRPRRDRGFPIDRPRAARRRSSSFSTRPSRTCRNDLAAPGDSTDIASKSIARPADAQRSGGRCRASSMAHADDELLQVKRLRQVLVGADLEAFEPALGRVERRHEHHGRRGRPCDLPREAESRSVRQLHVDDRQIPGARRDLGLRLADRRAHCTLNLSRSSRSASVRPSDASSSTSSTRVIMPRRRQLEHGRESRSGPPDARTADRRSCAARAAARRTARRPCRSSAAAPHERLAERCAALQRRAASVVERRHVDRARPGAARFDTCTSVAPP